jgi:hypothetical protein
MSRDWYLPIEEPRQGQGRAFASVQIVTVRQPGVVERLCQLGPVELDQLVCLETV